MGLNWGKTQELQRRSIQELPKVISMVESLIDFHAMSKPGSEEKGKVEGGGGRFLGIA